MMMHDVWRMAPVAPRRVGRRPDVAHIVPGLWIGEYPLPADIGWLAKRYSVASIISLQDADDLRALAIDLGELRQAAAESGVAYHHQAIADCRPEQLLTTLGDVLGLLDDAMARGQVTYVHCSAGLNRAPTVAVAYVHRSCGRSLAEACAWVKARRACGPYMRVLETYFAR